MEHPELSNRQTKILEFIQEQIKQRGFPPSVREIAASIGVSSSSTVHSYLNKLIEMGYLEKDPSTPRALRLSWDPLSGASEVERRPVSFVPLVGEVAAGTDVIAQENIEQTLPIPTDLASDGDLFMLKVKGDSMIEDGIFDGDFIVAQVSQEFKNGDVVIAGIPGEEATIKRLRKTKSAIHLIPANKKLEIMKFDPSEVTLYGKAVTVIRQL